MSSSRAVVTINTKSDRDQIARWAQNVELGTVVEFKKKTRSTEQNAKMHAMLAEVSDQVVWYGKKLSVEDWKNIFSASLRKAQVVPGIDPGTVVPLGIHTSTMTIDEMSNMIELIYHFGAQPEHPVTFKEPNTDQPNSEVRSLNASETDDASSQPAASSQEPGGDSPSPSPPGSTSSDAELSSSDRALLISCYGKLLAISDESDLDTTAKENILNGAKDGWKTDLPVHLHKHLKSFFYSALGVIRGHDKRRAAKEYAGFLECSVEELIGDNNG